MDTGKKVLVMTCSPRGSKSTSEYLGMYLARRLKAKSVETETVRLYAVMETAGGQKELLSSVDRADILILAFPLYSDTLPALAIKALEIIAEHRSNMGNPKRQRFAVIVNCGFPEAFQNDTAVAICRRFTKETGMEWAACLSVGGGGGVKSKSELFGGRPMEKMGFLFRKLKISVDRIADHLSGDIKSQEVMEFKINAQEPKLFYALGALLFNIRRPAKKNRLTWKQLKDRPFEINDRA